MNEEIIKASEDFLKRIEKIRKFGSKFNTLPYKEANNIVEEMYRFAEGIPYTETPKNQDELVESEVKRRILGEAINLEQRLAPRHYDFNTILTMYAIPKADLDALRPWLLDNKESTLEAIERTFNSKEIQDYELGLSADIPSIRRQAEEFAAIHIQKYHKVMGKMLEHLTKVGGFLRDIDAVPTTEGRSYFNHMTKTLAIGIPSICYTKEDGGLHIRERELIILYGHEGMGHALNQVVTQTNGIPYILKNHSALTSSTAESVAQFYQKVIFEDLKKSPQTQKELGILHNFDEIYQEAADIRRIQDYNMKLFQYAITVIADKELGHPHSGEAAHKKMARLCEVTLDPSYPISIVEQYRGQFDSQGNLNPQIVSELRYCAQPVDRALEEFKKQGVTYNGEGRSKIDSTLLKGFWSPIGFVDNARLNANEK